MATTWKFISTNLGDDDNVSVTIQEVVDSVDGEIFTSGRFHKKYFDSIAKFEDSKFAVSLKEKINASRTKIADEGTLEAKIDLTDFETFLKV